MRRKLNVGHVESNLPPSTCQSLPRKRCARRSVDSRVQYRWVHSSPPAGRKMRQKLNAGHVESNLPPSTNVSGPPKSREKAVRASYNKSKHGILGVQASFKGAAS